MRLKTLSELKSLEIHARHNASLPNARMLTFEELLRFARGKIKLVLDCKDIDPPLLIEQIRAAEMTDQVLVSAGKGTLRKVNAASHRTVPVMARYRRGSLSGLIASLSPAVVQIYGASTPGCPKPSAIAMATPSAPVMEIARAATSRRTSSSANSSSLVISVLVESLPLRLAACSWMQANANRACSASRPLLSPRSASGGPEGGVLHAAPALFGVALIPATRLPFFRRAARRLVSRL